MKSILPIWALLATVISATPALAHPGHGHGDGSFSLVHYLTEPQHILLIAGLLVGGLLVVHAARKAYGWLVARNGQPLAKKQPAGRKP